MNNTDTTFPRFNGNAPVSIAIYHHADNPIQIVSSGDAMTVASDYMRNADIDANDVTFIARIGDDTDSAAAGHFTDDNNKPVEMNYDGLNNAMAEYYAAAEFDDVDTAEREALIAQACNIFRIDVEIEHRNLEDDGRNVYHVYAIVDSVTLYDGPYTTGSAIPVDSVSTLDVIYSLVGDYSYFHSECTTLEDYFNNLGKTSFKAGEIAALVAKYESFTATVDTMEYHFTTARDNHDTLLYRVLSSICHGY